MRQCDSAEQSYLDDSDDQAAAADDDEWLQERRPSPSPTVNKEDDETQSVAAQLREVVSGIAILLLAHQNKMLNKVESQPRYSPSFHCE